MRLAQPLLHLTLKRQFAGYCATLNRVPRGRFTRNAITGSISGP